MVLEKKLIFLIKEFPSSVPSISAKRLSYSDALSPINSTRSFADLVEYPAFILCLANASPIFPTVSNGIPKALAPMLIPPLKSPKAPLNNLPKVLWNNFPMPPNTPSTFDLIKSPIPSSILVPLPLTQSVNGLNILAALSSTCFLK